MKTTIVNALILAVMFFGLGLFVKYVVPIAYAGMTWEDYQTEKAELTAEQLKEETKEESPSTLGVKQWNMAWKLISKKEADRRFTLAENIRSQLPKGYIVEIEGNTQMVETLVDGKLVEKEYNVYRVFEPVVDDGNDIGIK